MAPEPDLLEREGELAALVAAVGRAVAGHGTVVAILGPAGIGKTALTLAAAQVATAAGMSVRTARATLIRSPVGSDVVHQLLGHPLPDPLDGAAHLAALAADGPVALIVDDLHLADLPSKRAIGQLARRVGSAPVLLLVGAPEETGSRVVTTVASVPDAVVIRPAPLTREAVMGLAEARLGPSGRRIAYGLADFTGGNPLLVHEVLDGVGRGGAQVQAKRTITADGWFDQRLQTVSDDALSVLVAAAVLGDGRPLTDAATVAGVDDDVAFAGAVDELVRARLLRPGSVVDLPHPSIVEAVFRGVDAVDLESFHRVAARLAVGRGDPIGIVVLHLLSTRPSAEPGVAAQMAVGARAALDVGDPVTALAAAERGLLEGPEPDARASLLLSLGRAQLRLAPHLAAAPLEKALAVETDPGTRREIEAALAEARAAAG